MEKIIILQNYNNEESESVTWFSITFAYVSN